MSRRVYREKDVELQRVASYIRELLIVLSDEERVEILEMLAICKECGMDEHDTRGIRIRCTCRRDV